MNWTSPRRSRVRAWIAKSLISSVKQSCALRFHSGLITDMDADSLAGSIALINARAKRNMTGHSVAHDTQTAKTVDPELYGLSLPRFRDFDECLRHAGSPTERVTGRLEVARSS
jgi:hypothetical protein